MLIIGVDIDDTLTNTTLFANNILKASGIDNLEDYHDLEQVAFNEFIKKNIKRIQRDVTLKDDAKEVAKGYECGIQIEDYNDIKEGDIIEAHIMEEVKQ